ncbi:hypothetical protein LY76DRAFT_369754 [Colletotrichum caudatum]|nr:hypothetical protein LY76DRAFT_369754 [Colletotrichum caudatum]
MEGEHEMTKQQDDMPTVMEPTKPSTKDKVLNLPGKTSEAISRPAITPQVEDHAPDVSRSLSLEPDGRQESQEVPRPESQSARETVRSTQKSRQYKHAKGASSPIILWTCCRCGDSAMTINILSCPSCCYERCANYPLEEVKGKNST